MTFMRTPSGIANFKKFVGADILIYIEGKESQSSSSKTTHDELFYENLLTLIIPNKKVRFKCVGNKTNALEYAKQIEGDNCSANVVVVDRDADDLTCTLLDIPSIIYTYGYSWENDFWTLDLAKQVLQSLTCSKSCPNAFEERIEKLTTNLKELSALDLVCQINSEALLPKNGGACGINFSFKKNDPLPNSEIARIKNNYSSLKASSCGICTSFVKKANSFPPEQVIQGHLWEHIILMFIQNFCEGTVSNKIIKNLAMDKFSSAPDVLMSALSFGYYQKSFTERFE